VAAAGNVTWAPLDARSLVIDTNMAIHELRMDENGRLDQVMSYFGRRDLRITDRGKDELYRDGSRYRRFEEDPSAPRAKILTELARKGDDKTGDLEVGGPRGAADREIVAEVFCAKFPKTSEPPIFVTGDHGIFLALYRRTPYAKAIPANLIFRNFYPKGFEVTIEGRTIRVVPVPPGSAARR
jgi:hypothetical protein